MSSEPRALTGLSIVFKTQISLEARDMSFPRLEGIFFFEQEYKTVIPYGQNWMGFKTLKSLRVS